MPRRAFTSGRKFSTTTSARAASRRNAAAPAGDFKSRVMARLLRCRFWKSGPWRGPPAGSGGSRCSGSSTLMTLAPQSASCRTQVGPARTRPRSSTVKRASAAEALGTVSLLLDLVLGELEDLRLDVRWIVGGCLVTAHDGEQVPLLLLEPGDLEGEGEDGAQIGVVPRL